MSRCVVTLWFELSEESTLEVTDIAQEVHDHMTNVDSTELGISNVGVSVVLLDEVGTPIDEARL